MRQRVVRFERSKVRHHGVTHFDMPDHFTKANFAGFGSGSNKHKQRNQQRTYLLLSDLDVFRYMFAGNLLGERQVNSYLPEPDASAYRLIKSAAGR